MIKFDLRQAGEESHADVSGTPLELVELIATIMIENDICAKLILAATEVYRGDKSEDVE